MTKSELIAVAKPILFNTEMVKAILDGRKTVTRRNPFHFEMKEGVSPTFSGLSLGEYCTGHIETGACLYTRGRHTVWGVVSNVVKPKYKKGDILYVRETWTELARVDENGNTYYDDCLYFYATEGNYQIDLYDDDGRYLDNQCMKWRPSIHMPKEAARIFLKVTDVRVERLQDITEEQAWKEGIFSECSKCKEHNSDDCKDCANQHESYYDFLELWNSTIKKSDLVKYGWDANPYVWVYEFERIDVND